MLASHGMQSITMETRHGRLRQDVARKMDRSQKQNGERHGWTNASFDDVQPGADHDAARLLGWRTAPANVNNEVICRDGGRRRPKVGMSYGKSPSERLAAVLVHRSWVGWMTLYRGALWV